MADFEREFGWNDEINKEESDYEPLPEGDYRFTVFKIERSRSQGKGKLPPCNMAKVTVTVHGAEYDRDITENLVLHSSLEWKLSQFFLSIGMKKHDEPLHMDWMAAIGKTGNCRIIERTYIKNDGTAGKTNDIAKFYAYDEVVNVVQPTPMQQNVQQNYQQSYQQNYQQPSAPAANGWKPGSF